MNKLDTHYYDDLLSQEKIEDVEINEEELVIYRKLFTDPIALRAYDLITKNRGGNIYKNFDALKLLVALLEHEKLEDFFDYLEEQMRDIVLSGPCPQGRCFRLFQIYISL